jgi:flavin reductase (DIM6/NTAB) family NADH-FMN oxidoreductase RutF
MPEVGTEPAFSHMTQGLDTPMFIVTAAHRGERAGCLVGFASQVSIHPGRFLACISVKNHTHRVAARAATLAVHVVPDSQRSLAELFGGETGDEIDKFERCAWRPAPDGTPLLDACSDRFVGRVVDRLDLGDHIGYLLEPLLAEYAGEYSQLSMRWARDIEPGHEA